MKKLNKILNVLSFINNNNSIIICKETLYHLNNHYKLNNLINKKLKTN